MGAKLEEMRRAAKEEAELALAPQFRDMRCEACGHSDDVHYGGGKCIECPVERRCQRFVLQKDAVP